MHVRKPCSGVHGFVNRNQNGSQKGCPFVNRFYRGVRLAVQGECFSGLICCTSCVFLLQIREIVLGIG